MVIEVERQHVLLSFHREVAEKVLAGEKTLELRRVNMRRLEDGAVMLIYVGGKVGRVIGEATVVRSEKIKVNDLRRDHALRAVTGLDKRGVDFYVGDLRKAFGIWLVEARRYRPQVRLPEWLRPPQSFMYINPDNPVHQALLRRLPE